MQRLQPDDDVELRVSEEMTRIDRRQAVVFEQSTCCPAHDRSKSQRHDRALYIHQLGQKLAASECSVKWKSGMPDNERAIDGYQNCISHAFTDRIWAIEMIDPPFPVPDIPRYLPRWPSATTNSVPRCFSMGMYSEAAHTIKIPSFQPPSSSRRRRLQRALPKESRRTWP